MSRWDGIAERALPRHELVDAQGLPKPSAMTREEQLATAAVSLASFLLSIVVASVLDRLPTSTKPSQYLGFAALLCVGAFTSARFGNRLIAGVAVLLTGLFSFGLIEALGPFWMAPHYAVAMWMIFRMNRVTALRRTAVSKAKAAAGAAPRARTRAGADDGADLDEPPQKGASGRRKPVAGAPPSKRYTPPKGAKKRTSTLAKKR